MNQKNVSWDEFEQEALISAHRVEARPALFRGQRVDAWKLETTLERFGCREYQIALYHRDVLSAAVAIETVTGKNWSLSEEPTDGYHPFQPPADYPFLA